MIEKSIAYATAKYSKECGKVCQVQIDSRTALPKEYAGGIIASSSNGRIRCDNTLEARLEQCSEQMLPKLRLELFGPSEQRKFFD